jgi:hypothetical protein
MKEFVAEEQGLSDAVLDKLTLAIGFSLVCFKMPVSPHEGVENS